MPPSGEVNKCIFLWLHITALDAGILTGSAQQNKVDEAPDFHLENQEGEPQES